jgi:hypothetical protein
MIAEFPNFSAYSVQEILEFTKKVREFEPRSDFSPAYIVGYYNIDGQLRFCELNGNLIASYNDPETNTHCIEVFGANRLSETITEIFAYQKAHGLPVEITCLDDRQVSVLHDNRMVVERYIDKDEYVISCDDHARLAKKELAAESRAVRNFIKNYGDDVKIYELDLTNEQSVNLLINAWHVWREYFKNTNNDPDRVERKYTGMYLDHAHELPTRNFVISHADHIIAFGIFDVFEEFSCAVFHSLKVDYAYNHAFDFGLHVIANRLRSDGIKYINVEEDMGVPGIRYKKQHLAPVTLLKRYSVRPIS